MAVHSLNSGDFKGAETQFKQALDSGPQEVRLGSLFGLFTIELHLGHPQEAEKYLHLAQTTAPDNPQVYRAWGRYYSSRKKYTEAEQAFKKAVTLSQGDPSALMDLGDLYNLDSHKTKEAAAIYRQVLEKKPDHAGAHFALGEALVKLGQNAQAETELQQAARLAPTLPYAPEALGELYLREAQYDKALGAFSAVVKIKADFVPAHVGLGDAYWGKGNAAMAAAEYEKAAKLAPKEASLQIKLGMMDEWFGKAQEAEQAYLTAIRLDPKSAVAYNNLAWMTASQKTQDAGKLDQAKKWALKAVDLQPRVPAFQVTLGWTYRAAGDLGNATAILEKSAALNPQSPEVLYHLGIVYSETGKAQQARTYLTKALALEKSTADAEDIRKRLSALGH